MAVILKQMTVTVQRYHDTGMPCIGLNGLRGQPLLYPGRDGKVPKAVPMDVIQR